MGRDTCVGRRARGHGRVEAKVNREEEKGQQELTAGCGLSFGVCSWIQY